MNKLPLIVYLLLFAPFLFAQQTQETPTCGVNDSQMSADALSRVRNAQKFILSSKASRTTQSGPWICRLAIEIDSETFEKFDSDSVYIKREVLNAISQVSKVYEKEMNVRLVPTVIHIWKDAQGDPYRGNRNIYDLLGLFNSTWNYQDEFKAIAYQFDKALFITSKSLQGAAGIAYLGGTECVVPWGQAGLGTVAHELAHTFGVPHTQSCEWPEGPLDYCTPSEGSCYDGALNTTAGTIMSYCGPRLSTFHELCRSVIQQYAKDNLPSATAKPESPLLSANYNFQSHAVIDWKPIVTADYYIVQSALSANFSTVQKTDTVNKSVWSSSLLRMGQNYLRIKACNSIGCSEWSNAVWNVPTEAVLPPFAKYPLTSTANLSTNFTLTYTSVPNASAYEVQVAALSDTDFKNPIFQTSSSSTSVLTKMNYYANQLKWRVRSVVGTTKSAWSEVQYVLVSNPNNYISTNYLTENSSLKVLEYSGNYINNQSVIKLTIAIDSSFKKILCTKSAQNIAAKSTYTYSFWLDSLQSNQTYFVKVEELYKEPEYLLNIPSGVVSTTKTSFVYKGLSQGAQVAYFGKDNNPDLANSINAVDIRENEIVAQNARGIFTIQVNNLQVKTFDHTNTTGAIGNQNYGLSLSGGDPTIKTIQLLGKRLLPSSSLVYALRKLDPVAGKMLSSVELSNPDNITPSKFDYANQLFYGYSDVKGASVFGKIEKDSLKTLFTYKSTESNVYFQTPVWSQNSMWVEVYKYNSQSRELWQYDLASKQIKTFTKAELPQLSSAINQTFMDSKGVLWVLQNGRVLRYSEGAWEIQNYASFLKPTYIAEDAQRNIYVYDSGNILKYADQTWSKTGNIVLNTTGLSKMLADVKGNIWFQYPNFLIRYNTCSGAPNQPKLTAQSPSIEYGQQVQLTAQGCAQVTWSWSNKVEGSQQKTSTSATLMVNPTVTTTYSATCENSGCSSLPSNMTVNVIPIIKFQSSGIQTVCASDSIKLEAKVFGEITNAESFVMQVKLANGASQTIKPIKQELIGTQTYRITDLSQRFGTGIFQVSLRGLTTGLLSKDTLTGKIASLPAVSAMGDTTCAGEPAQISVRGGSTYQWSGPNGFSSSNSSIVFSKSQTENSGTYLVKVTDDNGCTNTTKTVLLVKPSPKIEATFNEDIINHTLTLSASGGVNYLWQGPNQFTSTNAKPIIENVTAAYNGTYTVRAWGGNSCTNYAQLKVALAMPLGFEGEINQSLLAFPNPAKDVVTLKSTLQGEVDVKLVDMLGNIVFESSFRESTKVSTADLNRGVYLVWFQSNKDRVSQKLILE
jgi:hypothetical protein